MSDFHETRFRSYLQTVEQTRSILSTSNFSFLKFADKGLTQTPVVVFADKDQLQQLKHHTVTPSTPTATAAAAAPTAATTATTVSGGQRAAPNADQ
jgi:hypothetical protein